VHCRLTAGGLLISVYGLRFTVCYNWSPWTWLHPPPRNTLVFVFLVIFSVGTPSSPPLCFCCISICSVQFYFISSYFIAFTFLYYERRPHHGYSINSSQYTGLLEMTVGVLTTCHTQYTSDSGMYFFYSIEQHSQFLLHTLQVLYMCTLCDSTNINTIIQFVPNCL